MRSNYWILILGLISCCFSCGESNECKKDICENHSIWRDHDGADSCSYYSPEKTCEVLQGKLVIQSKLTKGRYTPGVFEGGISSRWFQINKDSIFYFKPNGTVADSGKLTWENGTLLLHWKNGKALPNKAEVYFKNKDQFELRYFQSSRPTKFVGKVIQE